LSCAFPVPQHNVIARATETAVASGNICPQQTSATLVAKRQRTIKSSKLSKHGDLAGSAALSET